MDWKERIEIDPGVLVGKPVVKGTRLGVGFLLDVFAQGWTRDEVLQNYPQLSKEDIQAVFAYSAARVGNEEVLPIKKTK